MPEENELSMYNYIKVINKWKWLIVIGTLGCILTAGIVTFFLPRVYETRATLVMEGTATPDIPIGAQKFSAGLSLNRFFNLLPNDRDLNLEVIRKLELGKSPDELTPQALSQMLTFSLATNSRTITINVRYSHPQKARDIANTMAEEVKEHYQVLNEAEIAQSQTLIDEQLDLARASLLEAEKNLGASREAVDVDSLKKEIQSRVFQETKLTQEYSNIRVSLVEEEVGLATAQGELEKIEEQLDLARASLLEAEKNLEASRETVDVDSLKKEIQSRVSQETKLTQEYSNIRVSLVEEEAGLATAQGELEKQHRVYVLSKSIVEDVTYGRILDKLSEEDIAALQGVKGETQQINPVYVNLEQIATNARISVARAKAKKVFIEERIEENGVALSKLRLRLAEREGELEPLTEAHDLAKKLLLKVEIEENEVALNKLRAQLAGKDPEWEILTVDYDFAKNEYRGIRVYHDAAERVLAVANARQLKTASTAGVPSSPIELETKRILFITAIVGLLATLFLAFFLEYLERMRKLEAEADSKKYDSEI